MIRVNHYGPKSGKRSRTYTQPPINKFFNDFFNSSLSDVIDQELVYSRPSVNTKEFELSYEVEFAIPGLSKEDISIQIEKGILTVEAQKNGEKDETAYKTLKREFDYTSFKRTFKLPEDADQKNISARMENGVLTISILKQKEEDLRKTINVL